MPIVEAKAAQPSSPGTERIAELRNRVVGYAKQAESILKTLAETDRERIRAEYLAKYNNNPAALDADPEFQIRMREIGREVDRRKTDVQAVLKLIEQHDQVLTALAQKDQAVAVRERAVADGETRLKARVAEVDQKARDAVAAAERIAAQRKAEAEALLRQTEAETKQRVEEIAKASREVEALQAKLADELKNIDQVLNKAKRDLATKLALVFKEALGHLQEGQKGIDELLK